MRRDIDSIKTICIENTIKSKLLLIPAMSMRIQVLKSLNDNDIYPVNLDVMTIKKLAYDIAESFIINNGVSLIDSNSIVDIISDILNELKAVGRLNFFSRLEITSGLCKVLARSIIEVKKGGYLQGKVRFDKVENQQKRDDLELILQEYTRYNQSNGFLDSADLINLALDIIERGEYQSRYSVIYPIESCKFEYTEKLLLEKLNAMNQDSRQEEANHSDFNTSASEVHFVKTYGRYNEAKEVLRNILFNQIPFDTSVIISISNEPYAQLFYQLFQQYTYENKELNKGYEFPLTFGMGLPLLLSSPAKLLMTFLQWIGDGYKAHDFINIFSSGLFEFDEDREFGRMTLINCIKNSDLKWQRSTYLTTFEKSLESLTQDKNRIESLGEDSRRVTERIAATSWMLRFLKEEAFKLIPDTDDQGLIDVDELLQGLKSLINIRKRIFSALDGQGLTATLLELKATIKGRKIPLVQAIDIIKEHLNDIRIMQESPQAGKIHLTTFKTADWVDRENVFLVGLSADSFPGFAIEDPVLLDCERPVTMASSQDRIRNNIEDMNRLLHGIRGKLTLSYSFYDTIENRECYPAILYHKLQELHPENTEKKIEFVISDSEKQIDETDFWISNGILKGSIALEHPDYNYGINQTRPVNEVAGVIEIDEKNESEVISRIDPRNESTVLSASRIQEYLKCRYSYFLRNILRIKELTNEELDVLGWLSHFEIGHIYHKIFEEFCKLAKEDHSILKNEAKAIEIIVKLADEEIKRYEEDLPVASEYYTVKQKQEIIDNCIHFVEDEVNAELKVLPQHFEYEFGKDDTCSIELENGKLLKVNGLVDRIDKIESTGEYRIIDYKSGSDYIYQKMNAPDQQLINEASIQPILYYLALKESARKGDCPELTDIKSIRDAQYRFITSKGDYETIGIDFTPDSEQNYKEELNKLFNTMTEGAFTPTGSGMTPPAKRGSEAGDEQETIPETKKEKSKCNFCGFNLACKYTVLE